MRFQIATLVFLVVSSNALAVPHRRDIIDDSIRTLRRSLEARYRDAQTLDARGLFPDPNQTGDWTVVTTPDGNVVANSPGWNWLDEISCHLSPNCQ